MRVYIGLCDARKVMPSAQEIAFFMACHANSGFIMSEEKAHNVSVICEGFREWQSEPCPVYQEIMTQDNSTEGN